MTRRIVLIRHGETHANAARRFQGHGDSGLSPRGVEQAAALGRRLEGVDGLVVGSDLSRAVDTARATGRDPEVDPIWRELDGGAWEGLTFDEIRERHPEDIAAMNAGEDVALGGGERWSDVAARAGDAVNALADRLDDGQDALVFTHGGVIGMVVARLLGTVGTPPPWPIERVRNTSLTILEFTDRGLRLGSYNDFGHIDDPESPEGSLLSLIRHGQTADNVVGAWSGRTDTPLDEVGMEQASAAARSLRVEGPLLASPLRRALATAEAFGVEVAVEPDLSETYFGGWEGLTSSEVAKRFPDEWDRYRAGEDIAFGGTGERHVDVAARMRRVADRLLGDHDRVTAVSHGGAIRSLVASVVGLDHAARHRIGIPGNLRVTRIRSNGHGPVLVTYNATR